MAVLGRGISGLPLTTDSLIIGVGGVLDELPVGTLGQVLTVTSGGVDWDDPASGSGTITGAINLDSGAEIFAQDNSGVLEFRSLASGTGISLSQQAASILIENSGVTSVNTMSGDITLELATLDDVSLLSVPSDGDVLTYNSVSGNWEAIAPPGAGGGEANTGANIGTGEGVFSSKVSTELQFKSLAVSGGLAISSDASTITIDGSSLPAGTVTSIGINDTSGGLDFDITNTPIISSGNIGIELIEIAGVSGTYANPVGITVDNKGRITAISNTSSSPIQNLFETIIASDLTNVAASSPTDTLAIQGNQVDGDITTTITASPNILTITLEETGTPTGTFDFASVTVDSRGRITNIIANDVLQNVVEDTTPQLGGNLDVNGMSITNTAGTILIDPTTFVVGPVSYDMSSGPDEAFATKGYVDDSISNIADQNLIETVGSDSGSFTASSATDTLNIIGASGSGVSTAISGSNLEISYNNTAIENVVEDTTPQLGGDLDVNGNSIISQAGGNIVLAPNSTGIILAKPSYDMSLADDEALTTKGYVDNLFSGSASSIDDLTDVNTVGKAQNDLLAWNGVDTWVPVSDINIDTATINEITFGDIAGGGTSWSITEDNINNELVFSENSVDRIRFTLDGGIIAPGLITLNGVEYTFPASDGSSGDVLTTNGSGVLSFSPVSGGSGSQNTYLTWIDGLGGTTSANAINDVMTVTGGTGIATAVTNDTITISVSGLSIDDLSDVDVTSSAPSIGDLLSWNGTNFVPYTLETISIVSADTGSFTAVDISDTLNIVGGSNVSTSIATDTLTINVDFAGGATASINLEDLANVSASPLAGEALVYNGSTWASTSVAGAQNTWTTIVTDNGTPTDPAAPNTSLSILGGIGVETDMTGDTIVINNLITELNLLDDVTIGIPQVNDVLTWSGTEWIAQSIVETQNIYQTFAADTGSTTASTTTDILNIVGGTGIITNALTPDTIEINATITTINDLLDVDTVSITPDDNDVLTYLSGEWVAQPISTNDQNLFQTIIGDDTFTTAGSPTDTLLIAGGIGITTNVTAGAVTINNNIVSISDLSDVDTTSVSPLVDQLLSWNGSQWTPISLILDDVADVDTTTIPPIVDQTLSWDGSNWIPATLIIDDLADVDTTTIAPISGEVLAWNGSQWAPSSVAGGGEVNTGANVGSGTGGIFRDKTGSTINLRSLISGTNITVTQNADDITISVNGLSTVATSGDYNDLINTPSIPSVIDDLGDVDTTTIAPTNGQVLTWNGSQWTPETPSAGGSGINNVVEDTTPQLGGNLDVNGNSIVSTSNGNITLTPDGTGNIDLGSTILQKKASTSVTASGTAVFETYSATFVATYIDYVFQTTNGTRVGTLTIATDGTSVGVSDVGTDIGTVDIAFTGAINTTNVEITYTENNNDSGTLTWSVRQMTL